MPKGHNKTRSIGEEIIEGLKSFRDTLRRGEPVEKKFTVRTVELDLEPREYGPDDVRAVREQLSVSQALFARMLAVSVETVQGWEQGLRKPQPIARRLLDMIKADVESWRRILEESTRETTASA